MTLRILTILVATLALSGCGSQVGPAMANCTKYMAEKAAIDAPETDWKDWAIQSCSANLTDIGEVEFVKLWS